MTQEDKYLEQKIDQAGHLYHWSRPVDSEFDNNREIVVNGVNKRSDEEVDIRIVTKKDLLIHEVE